MGVKTITRLPKIIGELFFGISGNNYLHDYLPKIPGELFLRPFQVILRFITCVEFFYYLKFLRNSKLFGGEIFRCIGRLHPPCLPLSCFVLFVALHECIMKVQ